MTVAADNEKEGWLVFLFYFFLKQGNCPVVHEFPFPRSGFGLCGYKGRPA
jgi:hypothetical protein